MPLLDHEADALAFAPRRMVPEVIDLDAHIGLAVDRDAPVDQKGANLFVSR